MNTIQAVHYLESRRDELARVLAVKLEFARAISQQIEPARRHAKLTVCALMSEELDALLTALHALRELRTREEGGIR